MHTVPRSSEGHHDVGKIVRDHDLPYSEASLVQALREEDGLVRNQHNRWSESTADTGDTAHYENYDSQDEHALYAQDGHEYYEDDEGAWGEEVDPYYGYNNEHDETYEYDKYLDIHGEDNCDPYYQLDERLVEHPKTHPDEKTAPNVDATYWKHDIDSRSAHPTDVKTVHERVISRIGTEQDEYVLSGNSGRKEEEGWPESNGN